MAEKRKYKRLMYDDRRLLEQMAHKGFRIADIASTLGVHSDTIYKELRRCKTSLREYDADRAQQTL